MATWGDQTCQRFEATAVGFETGFSRLRIRHSNRHTMAPHLVNLKQRFTKFIHKALNKSPMISSVAQLQFKIHGRIVIVTIVIYVVNTTCMRTCLLVLLAACGRRVCPTKGYLT